MPQWEGGATYDQIWQKKEVAEVNWNQPALQIHNFIRGSDKVPGAWSKIDGQVKYYFKSMTLYTSSCTYSLMILKGLN